MLPQQIWSLIILGHLTRHAQIYSHFFEFRNLKQKQNHNFNKNSSYPENAIEPLNTTFRLERGDINQPVASQKAGQFRLENTLGAQTCKTDIFPLD